LLGYLANKAFFNPPEEGAPERYGTVEKKLHRIITIAAACANWHAQLLGKSNMRPGIDPRQLQQSMEAPKIPDRIPVTPIDFSDEELCMFTAEDFDQACSEGSFTNDDGTGYWATEASKSSVEVRPSTRQNKPDWATHVVWFNK
jgi:hypothetical protein